MPRVIIPPPYRGPTAGADRIDVEGATVKACLEAVGQLHPGFIEQVVAPDGSVHRFVNLFLNGDELERADALGQAVSDGDEVEILAAIAGG